ncbi:MAG: hypothetical protein RL672_150 [Actinomycetota bacterium]|jgi:hypothetical protein
MTKPRTQWIVFLLLPYLVSVLETSGALGKPDSGFAVTGESISYAVVSGFTMPLMYLAVGYPPMMAWLWSLLFALKARWVERGRDKLVKAATIARWVVVAVGAVGATVYLTQYLVGGYILTRVLVATIVAAYWPLVLRKQT